MDWREVTIYTTTEGIGPVEALLEDNGVEGYVLEDAADFEEFLKDTEIYWDYVDEDLVREKRAQETCLKIYLPDSDEGAKQYADIRAELENLKARDEEHAWGRLCTETTLTRQEDWEWGWKQYFKPFPVGKGFMIKPSWETVEDPAGPPYSGDRSGLLVRHRQPRHDPAVHDGARGCGKAGRPSCSIWALARVFWPLRRLCSARMCRPSSISTRTV